MKWKIPMETEYTKKELEIKLFNIERKNKTCSFFLSCTYKIAIEIEIS